MFDPFEEYVNSLDNEQEHLGLDDGVVPDAVMYDLLIGELHRLDEAWRRLWDDAEKNE